MAEAKLFYAVRSNDVSSVERILKEVSTRVNINHIYSGVHTGVCNRSRWCLLHICCEKGRYECAKLLLQAGADPNIADKNGQTPLIYAVSTQWYNLTKLLLSNKADVTSRDKKGACALHYAAASSDPRIFEACLEVNNDINIRDMDGKTPLMYATCARWCHLDTLSVLLARGADVNAIDYSCSRNALQTAILSLDEHDIEGWNGGLGLEETVKLLVDSNSNIANLDVRCQSAPMNIIQRYSELLNKHRLTAKWKECLLNCFKIMVNMGYDVNFMDDVMMTHKHGGMVLHLAAKLGVDRPLFGLVVSSGGDVNGLDSRGRTPLHVAGMNGRTLAAKILIQHNAKWNTMCSYETCFSDDPMFIQCTPFRLALEHYQIHFAAFLTDAGFKPSCEDCDISARAETHLRDTIRRNQYVANWWHCVQHSDIRSLFDISVSCIRWEVSGINTNISQLPLPNSIKTFINLGNIFK